MFDEDRSYFQHRAESEIERAQKATNPAAAKAHYLLAESYLDRLASMDVEEKRT